MKNLILSLIMILGSLCILYSQAPQVFKYQAIARNQNGNILTNSLIGIRITMLKGGQDGEVAYVEIQQVKSNPYGIINLIIGKGDAVQGNFSDINWGEDSYFIKIEMDISGGTDYKPMGSSQLYAVPYALYAEKAGSIASNSSSNEESGSSPPSQSFGGQSSGSKGVGVRAGDRNGVPNTKFPAGGDSHANVNDGNFGIGTASPSEKLEVSGNIFASGSISALGNFILYDNAGNPREVSLNPDGTWRTQFLCKDSIRDIREDNRYYKIVKIGARCWMAENLNYGTMITGTTDQIENPIFEKYCFDDLESKCDTFGGLYQWNEMMDYTDGLEVRGICPQGWHVPTGVEWMDMVRLYDGLANAGGPLKETGTDYWESPNTGATNSSGFSAFGGGERQDTDGSFIKSKEFGTFWSSAVDDTDALRFTMFSNLTIVHQLKVDHDWGLSLRCIKDFECGEVLIDPRDSLEYNTVLIGDQCWMVQNMNIGNPIPGITDQTANQIIEKYCYGDVPANCDMYGGLYQWGEAMQYETGDTTQGICPTGWYLPSEDDWNTLQDVLGGIKAGGKLKEAGYDHWSSPNEGATNESGFTGLPGGHLYTDNVYYHLHDFAYFWTTTLFDPTLVITRSLESLTDDIVADTEYLDEGLSVRCIKKR